MIRNYGERKTWSGSWRPDFIYAKPQAAKRCASGLQGGPNRPRRELLLAHPIQLTLRLLPTRDRDDFLENLPAHVRYRNAVEDHPSVDVHVALHVFVHRRVGRHLDRRRRLAAEHRAAARRE